MMKKEYMEPEMKILRLAQSNIISTSGDVNVGGGDEGGLWEDDPVEPVADIFTDEL